ncbi:MAG: DEAD/DEAH box helicase [Chlorobi bacterium]|nr:DEAD/DEAH box helicase [Chlorobiota bacterium]MCI0715328.1 DEAD/DEAH box helicase [Chlorobiota bacterium]
MTTLKFDELNLSKELIKAIAGLGYEETTPIQSQSIPRLMEGRDLIGQAQTGTGKTAAFGIPVIEKIDSTAKNTQAVVLCPTRELAIQVAEGFSDLLKYKKGIHVLPVYGGQSIDRQIRALKNGVQIIIATPGRLIDHLQRKTMSFENVNTVVLDEADKMLDMGFRDDIEIILKRVPSERQTILFSATMPKEILELAGKYLKNPEHVKVVHKELTVPSIQQFYYELKPNMKLEILSRLIDLHNPKLSLVFCNTKRAVDGLVSHLQARGYLSEGLHGDMSQNQRDRVMAKFRNSKLEILVATDVAARGLDVDDIDAVFNYDMPQDEEYYVHRIGRTARAGRAGHSHTFVAGNEFYKIRDIERYTKSKIVRKDAPSTEDVAEVRASSFLDEIKSAIGEGNDLKKYEHYIEKLMAEEYNSFEIAAGLVKMLLSKEETDSANGFKEDRRQEHSSNGREHKKDRNHKKDKSFNRDRTYNLDRTYNRDRSFKKDNDYKYEKKSNYLKPSDGSMVRLYVNAGRKNNIGAKDILGAFVGETGIPGKSIGGIDIYDKFTFVEVDKKHVNEVLEVMNDNQIKGSRISVEIAKGK